MSQQADLEASTNPSVGLSVTFNPVFYDILTDQLLLCDAQWCLQKQSVKPKATLHGIVDCFLRAAETVLRNLPMLLRVVRALQALPVVARPA